MQLSVAFAPFAPLRATADHFEGQLWLLGGRLSLQTGAFSTDICDTRSVRTSLATEGRPAAARLPRWQGDRRPGAAPTTAFKLEKAAVSLAYLLNAALEVK
jgi:hypothetical protein